MSDYQLRELPLNLLKAHEATEEASLQEVINALKEDRTLKEPIIVDAKTLVILDGHHRYEACRRLGFERIPCVLVDYDSERVEVLPRRSDIPVSKAEVIRRGLSGALYPPKTTKHLFHGLKQNFDWYKISGDGS